MDFTTVFETFNSAEASLVASRLEAAGFQPTILNEFSTLTLAGPNTAGGIRVQVPTSQSAEAQALLDSTVRSPAPNDAASEA